MLIGLKLKVYKLFGKGLASRPFWVPEVFTASSVKHIGYLMDRIEVAAIKLKMDKFFKK